MDRDLHVDPAAPRRGAAVADPPVAKPAPKQAPPAPAPDDSADALPEDVVMPDRRDPGSKSKSRSAAARRKGKHGRPR
jgi:hypothetical protein